MSEPAPLGPGQMAAEVLNVASRRAVRDEANEQFNSARDHAQTALSPYARAGVQNLVARLPDGVTLGRLSFEQPKPRITWDNSAVTAYVERTAPTEVVKDIDPSILANPDVVEWILEHHPEALRTHVRPAYLDLLAERLDSDGHLVDLDTGESVPVATVTVPEPSGRFQWKPDRSHHAWLLTALRKGELDVDTDADLLEILVDGGNSQPETAVGQEPPLEQKRAAAG
ncbi:hypothetical protein [Nocardiopsis sp. CNT312]|uniref:hypothetical protein n=1 Tax=Nocardiopsis sp. CNT312 TaxID=1137268 RepID=UPI0004B75885|nr:hypothetical protein [Nocardiopsis sp. CNT312]